MTKQDFLNDLKVIRDNAVDTAAAVEGSWDTSEEEALMERLWSKVEAALEQKGVGGYVRGWNAGVSAGHGDKK